MAHRQVLIDRRTTNAEQQPSTEMTRNATIQAKDSLSSVAFSTVSLDWFEYLGSSVASSTKFLATCIDQPTTAYWIALGRPPPAPNWLLPSTTTAVCLARPPPAPNWQASSFSFSSIIINLDYGGINFAKSYFCIRPNIHSILHPISSVTSVIYAEEAYWAIVWLISLVNGYGLVQWYN